MTGPRPELTARLAPYPDLAEALDGLDRAAATDAPVLLSGEPGSGRSTVARWLHEAGPRATGPRVEVDPAAVPVALFDSEIFGHTAGAFTGAVAREGRIARARGGTLVLDHVEDLPRAVQPKLLRLLAEGRYAPLGGRERDAHVRFIALAGEGLRQRAENGLFRQDLYYRLAVLSFRIPPLRRRHRDLPILLTDLLTDLSERLGRDRPRLDDATRGWMTEHPWPGNLTQVRGLLERQLVLQDGPVLSIPPPRLDGGRPGTLAEMEAEHIRRALAYSRGHQGRAAKILGISRKSLWERRKRLGIP